MVKQAATARSTRVKPQLGHALMVSPHLLIPDPGQPRQTIDRSELEALKQSIKSVGRITQPLQVRPIEDGHYRIIAGQRRWTAATELELALVPIVIDTGEDNYLQRRIAQMAENSQRSGLTELEKAQGLMIMWLAMNIEAFVNKATDAGTTAPEALVELDQNASPTAQIAALTNRLCQLAAVDSLATYISGGMILMPWQRAMETIGEGNMDARYRRRLLQVLDLDASLQDKLAGVPLNPKALRDLTKLPTDVAETIIDEGLATDQPENAIREAASAALKQQEQVKKEAEDEANAHQNDNHIFVDLDLTAGSASMLDLRDDNQNEKPDSEEDEYDLNEGSGQAKNKISPAYTPKEPTHKVSLPSRGSTPPERDGWGADEFAMLLGGFEALERAIDMAKFEKLNELQQRQIRSMWREMITTLTYSGMELPERALDVDELRWPML